MMPRPTADRSDVNDLQVRVRPPFTHAEREDVARTCGEERTIRALP